MTVTDTSEKGLESLIFTALVGHISAAEAATTAIREGGVPYGSAGYVAGDPKDYDRGHAVELAKLLVFLEATQPKVVTQLGLDQDGPKQRQFLALLDDRKDRALKARADSKVQADRGPSRRDGCLVL